MSQYRTNNQLCSFHNVAGQSTAGSRWNCGYNAVKKCNGTDPVGNCCRPPTPCVGGCSNRGSEGSGSEGSGSEGKPRKDTREDYVSLYSSVYNRLALPGYLPGAT